jgi:outer membrane protein TolC
MRPEPFLRRKVLRQSVSGRSPVLPTVILRPQIAIELDLWGRLARNQEAAEQLYQRGLADYLTVLVAQTVRFNAEET